ncbi:MAG TPA: response regulator transcription factor [Thermoanaerobaculia bacterium]|nr:response regulator transcription factor [Thermoanaerobaculia bacterium]
MSIVVIDDHVVVREGLRAVLSRHPDFEVVGDADDAGGALKLIESLTPDIAVLDLRLQDGLALGAIHELRRSRSRCRIVAYTACTGAENVCSAVAAGVHGYVVKNGSSTELVAAIRAVYRGRRYVSPEVAGHLADQLEDSGLTTREFEVLGLLAQGRKNKAIAEGLRIGHQTVKSHVQNILDKLGARTRTEAVRKALQRGMIGMD